MSMDEEMGRVIVGDDGNVELTLESGSEMPPDVAVKIACLLLKAAGCDVVIKDYRIFADASRVSARIPNTDARRRLDG